MKTTNIKLSILDQVPLRKGDTPTEALQECTQLASYADKLGYTRFWVAEHHNVTSLASSAPEVLIAHLGNHTKNMRLGSGGIMLPNYSTLKVAENFRLLESLFPQRIDLGIGRAPGTDRLTASILNPNNTFKEDNFIEQLYHLEAYLKNDHVANTIFEKQKVTPYTSLIPERWILSSSGESASFAAHLGMKLSFAHFINGAGGIEAVKNYKKYFKPNNSENIKPEANVAIFAFCSEDEEKIRRNQEIMDYRFIELERKGTLTPVSYEDIENTLYSPLEQERILLNRRRTIFGTPDEVEFKIRKLAQEYEVEEIMLITYTENFEDRLLSYQLLANQFQLSNKKIHKTQSYE